MKRIVLVAMLALGGCAIGGVAAQGYTAPDGRPGFLITCGGILKSMATCYNDARAVCNGQDYEVIGKSVTPRDDTITENRSLEIVCKR